MSAGSVRARDDGQDSAGGWRSYLRALGPGLITGSSDDDPSGIATYSEAGARFQFGLLWTALFTLPLSIAVQEICDRTALVTGHNLGELARQHFDRVGRVIVGVLLACLLLANTLNITADLLAVGAGMNLLGAGPTTIWAVIAGVASTVLITSGSFGSISRVFKVLCLSLLSYFGVLFFADVHWSQALYRAVLPGVAWSPGYLALLVAVLGTTLSPYLFFWQSADRAEELEAERPGDHNPVTLDQRSSVEAARKTSRSRFDVVVGFCFSNLVMFSIVVATASTIGANGGAALETAADAAQALRPVAGRAAGALFALGFIGSGMLAVPVLAGSAATALAGLTHREWGFDRKTRKAPTFYVLVGIGTIGGTVLSLLSIDPIRLLIVSAVVNGFAAAPSLIMIMIISNSASVMGEHRNRWLANGLGWATVGVMGIAGIALLVTTTLGIG